jgi:hypothetical protein
MIKSGLIIGVTGIILIISSSTLLSPVCAPCLGLFLGLLAGYLAGIFDKPGSSREAVKKGGIAGAVAGGFAIAGSLISAIINGVLLNPSNLDAFYQTLGIENMPIDQTTIWVGQIASAFCIGVFNLIWMAVLGIAGGALWYQISGSKQTGLNILPQ